MYASDKIILLTFYSILILFCIGMIGFMVFAIRLLKRRLAKGELPRKRTIFWIWNFVIGLVLFVIAVIILLRGIFVIARA